MPITEVVELDISSALGDVQTIGDALTAVASDFSGTVQASLADAASQPIQVTADTGTITASVDDALTSAGGTVFPTADTTGMVSDIESAASSTTAVITVEADTTQAQDSIDALAQSSTAAIGTDGGGGGGGNGVAGLAGALGGVATSGGAAELGISGATSSIGSSIPVFGAAAVALGTVAAAGDSYFNSAVNAQGATQRFNAQFGEFADQVSTVNVGGLNTSLSDLNIELGSSTSQTKNALSNLAVLGNQSGATGAQVAGAAENVAALSAALVAANPALGSVGDVASKLDRLLGRGGARLASYGISLDSAAINARALDIALERGSTTVTEFDKRAAGAQLAVEQLGGKIKTNVDQGVDNPIIKLRQFSAEFAKFTTSLGQPLVTPIFDILRLAQPVIESVAGLFGELVQALLPIGRAVIEAFGPLESGILNTITDGIAAFLPIIQSIASSVTAFLGPALKGLTPLFDALVKAASDTAAQLQPIVDQGAALASVLGPLLGSSVSFLATALAGLIPIFTQVLIPILKFGAVIPALISAAEAFGLIDSQAGKAGTAAQYYANAGGLIDKNDLAKGLKADADAWEKNAFAASEFTKAGPSVVDSLRRMGISADDLRQQLQNSDVGFKEFTAKAIEAGQVKIRLNGADVTAAQIRGLNGNLGDYLNTSGAVVVQGQNLEAAFTNQSNALNLQAQSTFTAIAAQLGLNDAQIAALGAQAQATFGADTYSNKLAILAQQQQEQQAAEAANGAILGNNANGWTALATAVANGTINTNNAAEAAKILGVDVDTASKFIKDAQTAVDNFVSNALQKFPTAKTVFEDLTKATNQADPVSLTNNLNAATLASLGFQQNIDTIAQKFPEVAKVLQEEGPKAAGAFAQSFLKATPEQQKGLEDAIVNNRNALGTIETDIKASIGNNVATASQLAQDMTKGFDQNLDFSKVTKEGIDSASGVLKDGGVVDPLKNTANKLGIDTGQALALGIASGMGNSSPIIQQAAKDAVDAANKAAREQAGIKSPSRLFAEVGQQLGAGMALGLSDSQAQVIAEAEAIVQAAAVAAAASPIQATVNAGVLPGSVPPPPLQVVADVNVTVGAAPNTDPAIGAQIGQALVPVLEPQLVAAIKAQVAAG